MSTTNANELILSMIADHSGVLPSHEQHTGNPLHYFDSDNNLLCVDCARKNDEFSTMLVDCDVNYDDPDLRCFHCGNVIENAYGIVADEEESSEEETTTPRKFTLEISLGNDSFKTSGYSEIGFILQRLGDVLMFDDHKDPDIDNYIFDTNGNKVGSYKFSTEASDYEE